MNMQNLKDFYPKFIADENSSVAYLTDPAFSKQKVVSGLISKNIHLAVCKIFIDKNFNSAKEHFAKSAFIMSYLNTKYEKGDYSSYHIFTTHYGFCYAVISDSSKLINTYLRFEDDFLQTFGAAFGKAVQASIKNDDTELLKQIAQLEKHTGKNSIAKHYGGVVHAFKGILQNDKALIEEGINNLLALHAKQEQQAVVKDFLHIEALTIAKLAYRRGIEVNINNTLVPKEMIPTAELEKYEGYDFFNELESMA